MYLTMKEIREYTEDDLDTALQCHADLSRRGFQEGSAAAAVHESSRRMTEEAVIRLCSTLTALSITEDERN